MNIKERLMNGEKSEDIMREFSASLARAKHEVEKERAIKEIEESKLSEARGVVVDSIMDYFQLIGFCDGLDETDTITVKEMLYNFLKESEKDFKTYADAIKKIKVMPMSKPDIVSVKPVANSDEILRAFLKKSLV